jgi:hypothetical protein
VEFLTRLREQRAFAGLGELTAAIAAEVARAERVAAGEARQTGIDIGIADEQPDPGQSE